MVKGQKYKKYRPLALNKIFKKKFSLFLLTGITFSLFAFSAATISIFQSYKKSYEILGKSIIFETRIPNRSSSVTLEIPTIIPSSTPEPTSTPMPPSPTLTPTPIKPTITLTPKPTITIAYSNKNYNAEKIGDTTYRISNITNDSQMALANEIFNELNFYRRSNGKTTLEWSSALSDFAQSRADLFASSGNLDSHAGFRSFMDNDGFSKIGFNGLGENSAMLSGNMKAERIIKEIFGADSDHDNNQLDASWQYVGVGIKDRAININFGKNKR